MTPTLFHHIGLQVCYHPASDILRPPIFFLASGTKFPMFPTGLSKRFLLHYWRGRFLNPAVSAACTRGEIDGQILQQEKYILIGLFFPLFYLFSLRAIYQLQRVTFQTTLHQTKTSDKITFYSKYDAWCVSLRVCVCLCVLIQRQAAENPSQHAYLNCISRYRWNWIHTNRSASSGFTLLTELLNDQNKTTFAQTINITQVTEINESFGSKLVYKVGCWRDLDLVFVETQTWWFPSGDVVS